MTFLALVVALILTQAWAGLDRLQVDNWYVNWQQRVANWGLPPALKLALAVLVPAVLAYLILDVLFGYIRINLRGLHRAVAQLLLDCPQIFFLTVKLHCIGVPQGMDAFSGFI